MDLAPSSLEFLLILPPRYYSPFLQVRKLRLREVSLSLHRPHTK
jgi:hypothetical protein